MRHRVEKLAVGNEPILSTRPRLMLVLGGGLLATARDYRFRLPTGSALVLDGGEPFLLRADGGLPLALLSFEPDSRCLLRPASRPASDPARSQLLPMVHEPQSQVADLLCRLAETLQRTGTDQLYGLRPAQSWLDALLAAQLEYQPLIDRCHGRTPERRRDLFVRLARVRTMLSSGDGGDADVGQLARAARLSPSHFVRLFHKVFGEPPHSFRLRRRMEHARALLCSSDLSVQAVMAQTGFDNHSCFARAFRRHFGCSASALRAQRQVGAA
ncbi:MAG: helix-turn-helix transcriptional regulator [Xanthomonadales bacterium]|nr:helix-turn-helix transcriptional regulator [Xanthomonadales bacterium]